MRRHHKPGNFEGNAPRSHHFTMMASLQDQEAGTVDTDLCQFGTCNDGHLVVLNARGGCHDLPGSLKLTGTVPFCDKQE